MKPLPHRTYREMMSLVEEVDEVLKTETPPGVMYALYVIGGVAMGSVFDARMTQDIDVATEAIPADVMRAAEIVAERHDMSATWINNQAAEFTNLDLPLEAFDVLYAGECLMVRGAKPEYLLAMKVMSGRGKDLQDIIDLAEATGIVTRDSLVSLCDQVYSHTPSYSLETTWVQSICDDIASMLQKKRSGIDISSEIADLAEDYNGT